jgi:bifunctional non-homologous end joining protein LigD
VDARRLDAPPVFVALREDKAPADAVRERPGEAAMTSRNRDDRRRRRSARRSSLSAAATLEIGGHALRSCSPTEDKVLWPADGYTKGDLIAYYRAAAPYICRSSRIVRSRCSAIPTGSTGRRSSKRTRRAASARLDPDGAGQERARRRSETFASCCATTKPALVYVANLAAIVLHVWTSREGSLDVPDFIFFDLDPGEGCTLATLAKTALGLRDALGEIGLVPVVKSSGGSGLHVAVPLVPQYSTSR